MAALTQATADFLKAYDPWTWIRYVMDGTLDSTGKVKDDPLSATSSPPPTPPPEVPNTPPPTTPPSAPPTYSGPTAREKLDALLPTGFESTEAYLSPSRLTNLVSGEQGRQRASAQDVIANAIRRGTLTESGRTAAQSALDARDAAAKTALTNYGSGLLTPEQDELRRRANIGRAAAGEQSGEFFDPTPYKRDVDAELSSFLSTLPGKFSSSAPGDLYSASSLLESGGGVTGPQNLSYDPYAVEGGQLRTGVEDIAPSGTALKKRTTSVF